MSICRNSAGLLKKLSGMPEEYHLKSFPEYPAERILYSVADAHKKLDPGTLLEGVLLGSPQGKIRLTTCHLSLLLYRYAILLKMLRVSIVRLGYIAFRFRGALPSASRFSTTISFAMKVASLSNGWRRHNDSNPSNLRSIERGEAPPNTSAVN